MSRTRTVRVSILSVGVLVALGGEAWADEAPGTAAAPAATPAPATPAEAPEKDDEPGRFRIGFTINGGVGSGGNLSGPTFGATFRVGWQINRMFGAYYQPTALVWAGSSDKCSGSCSIGAIAGVDNSLMGSLSPIDMLEIGLGPSLDYLSGGGVSVSGAGGGSAAAFSSVYFGVHGRVGLTLGSRKPDTGRRSGFTISADAHPTFAEGNTLTMFTLGLGADWR